MSADSNFESEGDGLVDYDGGESPIGDFEESDVSKVPVNLLRERTIGDLESAFGIHAQEIHRIVRRRSRFDWMEVSEELEISSAESRARATNDINDAPESTSETEYPTDVELRKLAQASLSFAAGSALIIAIAVWGLYSQIINPIIAISATIVGIPLIIFSLTVWYQSNHYG